MSRGWPPGKKRKSKDSAVLEYFKADKDSDYMVCQIKIATEGSDHDNDPTTEKICGAKIKTSQDGQKNSGNNNFKLKST